MPQGHEDRRGGRSFIRRPADLGLRRACLSPISSFVRWRAFFIIELHSRPRDPCGCHSLSYRCLDRTYRCERQPPMDKDRSISFAIVITSLDSVSRAWPQPAASRYSKRPITRHGPMPSVNAFWAACVASVWITCSSCRTNSCIVSCVPISSFTGYLEHPFQNSRKKAVWIPLAVKWKRRKRSDVGHHQCSLWSGYSK
jgi:hypothetical protein